MGRLLTEALAAIHVRRRAVMARSTPEQVRNRLGLVAAKKLESAADALHAYRMACLDCADHAAQHDRRKSLVGELQQMAAWLEGCCK